MEKKVAIVGHGGHSKVVSNILRVNHYEIIGYFDDKNSNKDIIGKIQDLSSQIPNYVIGIGNGEIRYKISKNFPKLNWINLIHPFTSISNCLKIGEGNVICPGVVIQPNVTMGNFNIINTSSSIDHECKIGSFINISPGVRLCGMVTVGDFTSIGAGSVIKNNITIGRNVIIGCGSNVITNIPDGVVAYGNPCKIVKYLDRVD